MTVCFVAASSNDTNRLSDCIFFISSSNFSSIYSPLLRPIADNGMRMSEVAPKGAILASAIHPLIAEVTLR
jgi:hypothetical protein